MTTAAAGRSVGCMDDMHNTQRATRRSPGPGGRRRPCRPGAGRRPAGTGHSV